MPSCLQHRSRRMLHLHMLLMALLCWLQGWPLWILLIPVRLARPLTGMLLWGRDSGRPTAHPTQVKVSTEPWYNGRPPTIDTLARPPSACLAM